MKYILDKNWQFLDNGEWKTVTVPHTPKIEDYDVYHPFQGKSYYRYQLTLPKEELKKRIVLEFEAVMQYCEVKVNGKTEATHKGGYLPFYVDLTGIARETNTIEVMADNSDDPDIPPGKPWDTLDFCYFGGIYRNVNLYITDKLAITHPVMENITAGGGVFVRYEDVSENFARVLVKVNVINAYTCRKRAVCCLELSYNGQKIGGGNLAEELESRERHDFAFEFKVENPHLWSTSRPDLYDLHIEIKKEDTLCDARDLKIGIRSVAVQEGKFLLNGKEERIFGTNRHQAYPYVGNAAGDRAQYRDALLLKNSGVNFIRLAHYPQAESFLSACDELGIMLVEPIPGWQWWHDTPQFRNMVVENAREMVRRDRNHPSIVFYEATLNETYVSDNDFSRKVVRSIKNEYPGDQCLVSGDTIGNDPEYIGFDINHTRAAEVKDDISVEYAPAYNGVMFAREYGDWQFGGNYSTARRGREDGDAGMLLACWCQWFDYNKKYRYPQMIGIASWVGIDYNRGYCPDVPICRCGLVDSLRQKKFQYYMFQSQQSEKPMAFIANYWENKPLSSKIVVFSNCDEVELVINGRPFKRQQPDNGPDREYLIKGIVGDEFYWKDGADVRDLGEKNTVKIDAQKVYLNNLSWNGGNCRSTRHPPFTFENVPYKRGYVEAIGYIDGVEAARHRVNSYGEPHHIEIEVYDGGVPLSRNDNDFIFVNAVVKDADGNTVYNFDKNVAFDITGGSFIGPGAVNAIAGVATVMIKAYGEVNVTARCGRMKSEKHIDTVE